MSIKCKNCGSYNTEEDPVVFSSFGDSIEGSIPVDFNPFSIFVDIAENVVNAARKSYEVVTETKRYYCNDCRKHFYVAEDDE